MRLRSLQASLFRSLLMFAHLLMLVTAVVSSSHLIEASAGDEGEVVIKLDGLALESGVEQVIVSGRTLVPLRFIADSLGISLDWRPEAGTVVASGYGRTVTIEPGNNGVVIDGRTQELDVPPMLISGRTYVPVRFFSTAFGGEVAWDGITKTVDIISPPKRLFSLAFYAIRSFDERHFVPRFDAVAFGWSHVSGQGCLALDGADFRWPEPAGEVTGESIVRGVSAQGSQSYLVLFGDEYSENLTSLLAEEKTVKSLAREAASLVVEKGFDGLLLDFERLGGDSNPESIGRAKQIYNEFLWTVRQELQRHGKALAVAVHPPNSHFKGYDLRTIGQVADLVVLMSYDYEAGEGPEPLEKVHEGVRQSLTEIPREKLLLGISSWSENDESVIQKVGIAKRYGLKGVSFWRLGLLHRVMTGLERTGALRPGL